MDNESYSVADGMGYYGTTLQESPRRWRRKNVVEDSAQAILCPQYKADDNKHRE
jgi:hypothetical protein